MLTLARVYCLLIVWLVSLQPLAALAHTFGLVAKSIDDGNFVDAWHGCQMQAQTSGDQCILIGNRGAAEPRLQLAAIQNALTQQHYDALAISVTESKFLAKRLTSLSVPIVTFDSPFSTADQRLSQTYIGVDNVAFGRELGRIAQQLRPGGGTLCIMTAHLDTNLQQRVNGLRQQLSQNDERHGNRPLKNENGWTEISRCPWGAGDDQQRALKQLRLTIDQLKPDVFISVGWWPLIDPQQYLAATEKNADRLINKKTLVIIGTGKVLPEYRALLRQNRVHALVSIDFQAIGRASAKAMQALVEGDILPERIFVPFATQTRSVDSSESSPLNTPEAGL